MKAITRHTKNMAGAYGWIRDPIVRKDLRIADFPNSMLGLARFLLPTVAPLDDHETVRGSGIRPCPGMVFLSDISDLSCLRNSHRQVRVPPGPPSLLETRRLIIVGDRALPSTMESNQVH